MELKGRLGSFVNFWYFDSFCKEIIWWKRYVLNPKMFSYEDNVVIPIKIRRKPEEQNPSRGTKSADFVGHAHLSSNDLVCFFKWLVVLSFSFKKYPRSRTVVSESNSHLTVIFFYKSRNKHVLIQIILPTADTIHKTINKN